LLRWWSEKGSPMPCGIDAERGTEKDYATSWFVLAMPAIMSVMDQVVTVTGWVHKATLFYLLYVPT